MQVNLKEFLDFVETGEEIYPGKRVVKACKQVGEFKSHCVVFDWRNPDELLVEVKAGLTGKPPENLRPYPVCFQTPTFVKIAIGNDNELSDGKNGDEDKESDDDGKQSGSSSGGGGKKPAKRKQRELEDIELISGHFGSQATGGIPSLGRIKEMVVMGVKITKTAFEKTFTELAKQIQRAKVSATEILAKTGEFVTRVQPPSFIKPRGDETVKYRYDRMKNADIGLKNPSL